MTDELQDCRMTMAELRNALQSQISHSCMQYV